MGDTPTYHHVLVAGPMRYARKRSMGPQCYAQPEAIKQHTQDLDTPTSSLIPSTIPSFSMFHTETLKSWEWGWERVKLPTRHNWLFFFFLVQQLIVNKECFDLALMWVITGLIFRAISDC